MAVESVPSVGDVQRIVAIENPVIRNLEITYCYSRLAAASTTRNGEGANWCTYATWASRQAGGTIRGEDLLENLGRRLGESRWLLHPVATLWRKLLRRGLFQRETRIGRLTHELHTPFDAFERASDAVARGNLRVFEEIGLQFARFLHDCPADAPAAAPEIERFLAGLKAGDPPEGQRLLKQAFKRYERMRFERDPQPACRASAAREPGDRPPRAGALAAADPRGARCRVGHPGRPGAASTRRAVSSASRWWAWARGSAAAALGVPTRAIQRASSRLAREAITDSLMVMALPGRVLALGTHLADAYPDELANPTDPELNRLLARFEPAPPLPDDCGARDWSDFDQRMHYIVHLFRAFHLSEELSGAPFTPAQVASFNRGVIPEGDL